MKKFFDQQKFLLILLLCLFIFKVNGQGKFEKTSSQWAEIKKLKAKVEAEPLDMKAHENYIWAYNPDDPSLVGQYRIWMKQFPKNYIVPFAIGQILENRENTNAAEFLLQACALKPDNAAIWTSLAGTTYMTNDTVKRKIYLQKAAQLEPKNSKYVFNYILSLKDTDPEKYDSLSIDIARKFPDDEVGIEALSLLAQKATVPQEKIAYFKQIFNRKTNHKSDWYVGAMEYYSDILLQTDPAQAFELGTAIILDNNLYLDLWHERLVVADAFLKAKASLDTRKPNDAIALLNKVRLRNQILGRVIGVEEYLNLFKAEALDSAKLFKAAYDTVAVYYSKNPSEKLQSALYKYGKESGMDSAAVNTNIALKRSNQAKQATEFSLNNYTDGSKKSLSDYRGKVVLLTYWFPGCSPCRTEFPHFEAVLKKFNKSDVAYLGLNLQPSQDDAVIPFLKESGYSFTPLHDSLGRGKGNLPADGAPTNYLIDQKGRIIFSKFRIDAENEKTLELMIKELLAEK